MLISRRNFVSGALCSSGLSLVSSDVFASDPASPARQAPREIVTFNGTQYYRAILGPDSWSLGTSADQRIQTFEVRPGDKGYKGDFNTGNERSELVTAYPDKTGKIIPFGVDYWLSFSFRVNPGPPITSNSAICGQFHDVRDEADIPGLSPPLCFVVGRTRTDSVPYFIHARYDSAPASEKNPKPSILYATTLKRNIFYNIVCRVRFDFQKRGEFQLWIDGKECQNKKGISIGYNHSRLNAAAYWQYGIYRDGTVNPLSVSYANMEQGLPALIDPR